MVYGENRGSIASLAGGWKPSGESGKQTVECTTDGAWVSLAKSSIVVVDDAATTRFTTPVAKIEVKVEDGAWKQAPTIVSCKVPLVREDKMWKQCETARGGKGFAEINLQKGTQVFKQLAWFTSRLTLPDTVTSWSNLKTSDAEPFGFSCEKCAPAGPGVAWKIVSKGNKLSYQPQEDVQEAGAYEHALKRRPTPFKVVIKKEGEVGHMDIACNGFSLAQRARALLPKDSANLVALEAASEKSERRHWEFSWRVVEHKEFSRVPDFSKLFLTSNKKDGSAAQPPNFKKFGLRPEQLRSLNWMLAQEATKEPCYEEEVSEAILGPMGWRAEGRVRRPTLVRGGIVADQVGYGKTAITLGLIDAAETVRKKRQPTGRHVRRP
jgi:hypothetical protein